MHKIKSVRQWLLIVIPFMLFFVCSSGMPALVSGMPETHFSAKQFVQPMQNNVNRNGLYDSLHLDELGLSRSALNEGLSGLALLVASGDIQNSDILSIIDLTLPSSRKRLFVIDVKNRQLIFNTYVSHGRNSGREMATQFSNKPNSYQSSLGFYVTGDTYAGHHGYSLKLKGKEAGINDNAFARGIVMHSASYVNEHIAVRNGCIGRSEGCPAIPVNMHRQLIERIKNGTCLFLYSADKFYATHSKMKLPVTG